MLFVTLGGFGEGFLGGKLNSSTQYGIAVPNDGSIFSKIYRTEIGVMWAYSTPDQALETDVGAGVGVILSGSKEIESFNQLNGESITEGISGGLPLLSGDIGLERANMSSMNYNESTTPILYNLTYSLESSASPASYTIGVEHTYATGVSMKNIVELWKDVGEEINQELSEIQDSISDFIKDPTGILGIYF